MLLKTIASVVSIVGLFSVTVNPIDELEETRTVVISEIGASMESLGQLGSQVNRTGLSDDDKTFLTATAWEALLLLDELKEQVETAVSVVAVRDIQQQVKNLHVYDFIIPQASYAAAAYVLDHSINLIEGINDEVYGIAEGYGYSSVMSLGMFVSEHIQIARVVDLRGKGERLMGETFETYSPEMFDAIVGETEQTAQLLGEAVTKFTEMVRQ